MKNQLTEEDVVQVLRLLEALERSPFDYLQLDVGELKLTIGKGEPGAAAQPSAEAKLDQGANKPPPALPAAESRAPAPSPDAPAAAVASPIRNDAPEDTMKIEAPIVGRFYCQPEPGARPYVSIGMQVDENTTVGLIEVMKVYHAVTAGVRGVVAEICVKNAEFVEYGQTLFRVRPLAVGAAAQKTTA